MTNEMIGKKEDLHEVDWVKEQTKLALSDLQKEVLYTKEGDEVKFDVDTALNYLQTLKDAKTWSEMVSKNSGATIMAIQILLKNKGYDVRKIDGILRTKGRATSNTMEAIKKFQRENDINPDGVPRPDTLRKLLELYENGGVDEVIGEEGTEAEETKESEEPLITREEYRELKEKESLTDDEVKKMVDFANSDSNLVGLHALLVLGVKNITDEQAEILSNIKGSIWFEKLESITDKQAEELGKVESLKLNGLTSITDKQAEELGKVEILELNGLTSITDKQVEYLGNRNSLDLALNGLTSITDKQAEYLGKDYASLELNGLTSITDKQAEYLGNSYDLALNGLTSITDKQAEYLGKVERKLEFKGLTGITDKQAEELVKVERLYINKNILTPKQKEILKIKESEEPLITREEYRELKEKESLTDDEVKKMVDFANSDSNLVGLQALLVLGVKNITDEQAEILSNIKGSIWFEKLESITDKQAEELGKVDSLELNGLTSITDKQAEYLGNRNSFDLALNGLTSITDKQAEYLGKDYASLELNGLTSITDKQAEYLGNSYDLELNGLTSITDRQAEELAKVENLYINKNILTPEQKEILKAHIS